MRQSIWNVCVLILSFGSLVAYGAFKPYKMDTSHSTVQFDVKHLKFATVTGQFKSWEGQFGYDKQKKIIKDLEIKFNVDTITTNNDDRDAHLKSPDFFGVRDKRASLVESNQYIVFKGSKFSFDGKGKLTKVAGMITIKGMTKPLSLMVTELGQVETTTDHKIMFNAVAELNRKDFGLSWDKPSTGILTKAAGKFVGDAVKIRITGTAYTMKSK